MSDFIIIINSSSSSSSINKYYLDQWYSNLSCEIHFTAEFSSNPDQTHLPVVF